MPANGVQPLEADLLVIADILRRRLETLGVAGASVGVDDDQIIIEVPTLADGRAVRRVVSPTGRIDFVPLGTEQVEEGNVLDLRTHPPLFGGDQVESATVGEDDVGGFATGDFTLRPPAAAMFAEYTKAHIGEYFAITLDGRVISAPVIMSGIDGGRVQLPRRVDCPSRPRRASSRRSSMPGHCPGRSARWSRDRFPNPPERAWPAPRDLPARTRHTRSNDAVRTGERGPPPRVAEAPGPPPPGASRFSGK